MFYIHKQSFTISPNTVESQAFINHFKKRLLIEPTISESTTSITLVWTVKGYIPEEGSSDGK